MPLRSLWGETPRQSVERACRERGREDVVRGCLALLAGGEADPGLVRILGGPRAARFLDAPPKQRYWLRLWGARGLLWAWDDSATPVVVRALTDDSWRVREMAAKVIARHRLDEALEALTPLRKDPILRVRTATARALRKLTEQSRG